MGNNRGLIRNCTITGNLKGESSVGGIVGINEAGGQVINCTFNGTVVATHYVGGIVGQNLGSILQCVNQGGINTVEIESSTDLDDLPDRQWNSTENVPTSTDIGGITGYSSGIVQSCRNIGAVGYAHIGYNVGGIAGRQAGSATMTVRLLGVVPIKQVSVRVEEEKVLVPGGQAVGVAIRTAGVLVVGASDLGGGEASPAREAGVRAGDLITAVDGEPVNEAERLSELVNGDAERRLTLNRAGQELSVSVRPRQDARDQAYRLGVWVRDSTAGVGTLSFYDPATGAFGALGHAITDLDTGVILPVSHGEVLPGSVSVMGLMNDPENRVRLVIDREVLEEEYVGCHPCKNTSSIKLRTSDLLEKFLPAVHHTPTVVTL